MLKRNLSKIGFTFSLPAILFYFFLMTIPILATFYLSFTKWSGFNLKKIEFIGFQNYISAFGDKILHQSLLNTMIFVVLTTIFLNLFGFILAVIIDTKISGTRFLRNAIFLPCMVSAIIIGAMWSRMLDYYGIINKFLQSIHLIKEPILFLSNPNLALYTIVIAIIWQCVGFDMILYYAGIQGIPVELIEAAKIDGSSKTGLITKIILPLLGPVITVCILLNVIGGVKVFGIVFAMTSGGPYHSTEVLGTYLYNQSFVINSMGYSSVIAVIITIIGLIISIIRIKTTRET